jgi:hypothetical protein
MRESTHCKNTVAFSFLTVHLYVVIAPFLNKLDHESGLHKPRKHGGEREYHLTLVVRKVGYGRCNRIVRQSLCELRWRSCSCKTCRTSRLSFRDGQGSEYNYVEGMSRVEKHGPAVEVKQNARPARHEDPTVPSTPANGRESKRPIDDQIAEGFVQVESGGCTAYCVWHGHSLSPVITPRHHCLLKSLITLILALCVGNTRWGTNWLNT